MLQLEEERLEKKKQQDMQEIKAAMEKEQLLRQKYEEDKQEFMAQQSHRQQQEIQERQHMSQ
jgi:hypothetical protein